MPFWQSLKELMNKGFGNNCIIGGDFNTTLLPKEKSGGIQVLNPFREVMEDLIAHWDLIDIKPPKGRFI